MAAFDFAYFNQICITVAWKRISRRNVKTGLHYTFTVICFLAKNFRKLGLWWGWNLGLYGTYNRLSLLCSLHPELLGTRNIWSFRYSDMKVYFNRVPVSPLPVSNNPINFCLWIMGELTSPCIPLNAQPNQTLPGFLNHSFLSCTGISPVVRFCRWTTMIISVIWIYTVTCFVVLAYFKLPWWLKAQFFENTFF